MAGTRSRIYVRPIATAYMYMHVSNSLYDKHSLTMPSAASDAASASRPAVGKDTTQICATHKVEHKIWGATCMKKIWTDIGCTAHLPTGIVDSLAAEPVFDSLVNFLLGVRDQAKGGSVDAQLACFGHEEGYVPPTELDNDDPKQDEVWDPATDSYDSTVSADEQPQQDDDETSDWIEAAANGELVNQAPADADYAMTEPNDQQEWKGVADSEYIAQPPEGPFVFDLDQNGEQDHAFSETAEEDSVDQESTKQDSKKPMPPDTTEDTMNMSDAGPPTAQETAMPEAQPFSPEGLATMGTETHHMHDVSLSITKENGHTLDVSMQSILVTALTIATLFIFIVGVLIYRNRRHAGRSRRGYVRGTRSHFPDARLLKEEKYAFGKGAPSIGLLAGEDVYDIEQESSMDSDF